MKTSTYIILGILVIMMVIIYVIKYPIDYKDSTFEIPDVQSLLSHSRISSIDIEHDRMLVRLEKTKIGWKLTEPVSSKVDTVAMNEVLNGLKNFKFTALVSTNPSKQQIYNVTDDGVLVTLTHDDGKKVSFVLGKFDSISNQTFVRFPLSDTVFTAQGIRPAMFLREIRDWRERTIFELSPEEIKSISLKKAGEEVVARWDGTRWIAEGKVVPSSVITPVIQTLASVKVDDFVDSVLIITEPPHLQVAVHEKEIIKMDLFRSRDEKYLLKASTYPNIFVVSKSFGQQFSHLADALFVKREIEKPIVQPPPVTKDTKPTPPTTVTPAKKAEPVKTQPSYTPKVEEEGELIIYTVQKGETLESIAKKFRITVDDIRKWNQLRTTTVKPGTDLYLFVIKQR